MGSQGLMPAEGNGFEPLKIPLFRYRFIAATVSNVGSWMQDTAGTWLMTALTTSPLLIALMQTAALIDISSRTGKQTEEQHRQARGGLHQRNQQWRGCQHRHQPRAGGVLHPRAYARHRRRDPTVAKERDLQRCEGAGALAQRILIRRFDAR